MEQKSKYMHVEYYDKGAVLHSTLSGATAFVRKTDLFDIEQILTGCKAELSVETIGALRRGKFIATESKDDEGLTAMWDCLQSNKSFKFIVITSEDCNFRCRYCYEKFRQVEITQGACNALVAFAQNEPALKKLHIEWFGGEPLIAYQKIVTTMRELKRFRTRANLC